MTTIELFAKNEVLELVTSPTVSSGDVNEVELYVEFGEEWQGLAKVAVFFNDEFKEPFERLLENGRCKVPNEVLKNHVLFFVGIRGAKNDILKTTDIVKYTVTKGVPAIIKDVNLDIYQQILAGYANLEDIKKQAEGWAHGREDLPERAEDNAKYYCGKTSEDAKKTAEDRKEVERLVESVSGIDEQVTKVEELSKNAQEAATQAGTSAEQAELHKQAAETASSAAQTAAQETEADKVSVGKLSAQVQKNKESVDKTAQDFALNAQQALADVNNAGQTQTERVQTAGNTAVGNIQTAQNTATQAVETAKTEAVKTVQTEGTTQTGAVTAEGERQVQAVQTATQEIIADREQITKNKTDIADLRQNKADAIVENVRGTLLNVKDSANAFFEDFSVYGKSEQVQTTGKNLWSLGDVSFNGYKELSVNYPAGNYVLSFDVNTPASSMTVQVGINIDGNWKYNQVKKDNRAAIKISSATGITAVRFYAGDSPAVKDNAEYYNIQIEKKADATAYEPYTGGKPSPSPEYPQEIVNAGRLNEDTGKYEIEIKVTGKNIFNVEKLNDKWNVGVNYYYIPLFVRKGSRVSFSVSKKLTTGLKAYALFSKEFGGNEKAYSWIYHSSKEGLIKAKGTFTAETDVISLSFAGDKAILINELFNYLQVEISETPTAYEPYKEQTLTLTSDRPLTKWDRLVEQGGQIGWLYNSVNETIDGKTGKWSIQPASKIFYRTDITFPIAVPFCSELLGYDYSSVGYKKDAGITINNLGILCITLPEEVELTLDAYKQYLTDNPLHVLYKGDSEEFVPLPQEQQDAIRALSTYYPSTVVSNSENMKMELSYVADTKNYTDRKIEEAVSVQIQNLANLLSLMPLSTQAAMIENDTNNILDMEVQR